MMQSYGWIRHSDGSTHEMNYASCRTETVQLLLKCLLTCTLARSLYPQILESLLTTGGVNVGGFSPPTPHWLTVAWLSTWESEIMSARCRRLCRPTLGGGRREWSRQMRRMMNHGKMYNNDGIKRGRDCATLPCHLHGSHRSVIHGPVGGVISPTVSRIETGEVWYWLAERYVDHRLIIDFQFDYRI